MLVAEQRAEPTAGLGFRSEAGPPSSSNTQGGFREPNRHRRLFWSTTSSFETTAKAPNSGGLLLAVLADQVFADDRQEG